MNIKNIIYNYNLYKKHEKYSIRYHTYYLQKCVFFYVIYNLKIIEIYIIFIL